MSENEKTVACTLIICLLLGFTVYWVFDSIEQYQSLTLTCPAVSK